MPPIAGYVTRFRDARVGPDRVACHRRMSGYGAPVMCAAAGTPSAQVCRIPRGGRAGLRRIITSIGLGSVPHLAIRLTVSKRRLACWVRLGRWRPSRGQAGVAFSDAAVGPPGSSRTEVALSGAEWGLGGGTAARPWIVGAPTRSPPQVSVPRTVPSARRRSGSSRISLPTCNCRVSSVGRALDL
jgi:hypothetical protein